MVEHTKAEIDYDRLANAIAKAVVQEERKEREEYSMSREWMKFIMYPVFFTVVVIMGCLAAFSFLKAFILAPDWNNSIVLIAAYIMLGLISLTLCLSTFWANKDLEKEKDKQYIASMFSNITSLVALIVAFVALIHEI